MTTFRTFDRTVALRCKLALKDGSKITVSYEASNGWNQVSGTVHSVLKLNVPSFKPCWDITITDPESDR
jgi:hypothetical protein